MPRGRGAEHLSFRIAARRAKSYVARIRITGAQTVNTL
jgi:hypothetical protein